MTPENFDRNKEHKEVGILGNIPKVAFFDEFDREIDHQKSQESLNKAMEEYAKKLDNDLFKEVKKFSKRYSIPFEKIMVIEVGTASTTEDIKDIILNHMESGGYMFYLSKYQFFTAKSEITYNKKIQRISYTTYLIREK